MKGESSFEDRLYILRDKGGEINREEIAELKDLHNKLSKHEGFVGLTPFGSVVSGYSEKTKPSSQSDYFSYQADYLPDIDIYVLYDSSKIYEWDHSLTTDLEEIEKTEPIKIHHIFRDISIQTVRELISLGIKKNDVAKFVTPSLVEITQMVTGDKIESYRQAVREILKELPRDVQKQIFDEMLKLLVKRDDLSLGKRKKRIPKKSSEEHQQILKARKKLWEERIKKIWEIEE